MDNKSKYSDIVWDIAFEIHSKDHHKWDKTKMNFYKNCELNDESFLWLSKELDIIKNTLSYLDAKPSREILFKEVLCNQYLPKEDGHYNTDKGFYKYSAEDKKWCMPYHVTWWFEPTKINEKEFKVFRSTNGLGCNNLLAIIEEGVPDVYIGTVIIVPYAQGYVDPTRVLLQCDENFVPMRMNGELAIVLKYIYD